MNHDFPDVTVVVCTYNRADLLRSALASLCVLETDGMFRYEVLVVDNASTDDTPAVIREAAGRSAVPLRMVDEPRQGVAFARNRGVLTSQAAWIAFFDDDQIADPDWLKELWAVAREKGVRCVGGANRLLIAGSRRPNLAPVCRGMLGETAGGDRPRPYAPPRLSPGTGNLLLCRSVFEEIGLFDETRHMAGEDGNLFRRMRAAQIEAWYTPGAVMHHVVPAYRVEDRYLRWKSLGYGRNRAEGNWRDWGPAGVLALGLARLGHALAVCMPRLAWARLRKDEDQAQGVRCMLWRAEGYTRYVLHRLAPTIFRQHQFLARLEFRRERELFADATSGPGGEMPERQDALAGSELR